MSCCCPRRGRRGLWQILTGVCLIYLVVGFVGEIALGHHWLF